VRRPIWKHYKLRLFFFKIQGRGGHARPQLGWALIARSLSARLRLPPLTAAAACPCQKRPSCGARCGPLYPLITKPCWSACESQPPSSTRWLRIGKANAKRRRAKVATGVGLPSTAKPWTAYHAAWLQSASRRTNGYSKHVNGSQHPAGETRGETCRAFTVHRCMHARLIDRSPK
jgi:hypothetical protein